MTPRHIGICLIAFALLSASVSAGADVVVVVSARSAITSLSKSQLGDVFLGRMSRLPDGGLAVPIDQAEGSVARDEFYKNLFGRSPAQMKAYWSRIIFTGRGQPPRTVADGLEMRKIIAANPASIGYIDAGLVDGSVRVLQ